MFTSIVLVEPHHLELEVIISDLSHTYAHIGHVMQRSALQKRVGVLNMGSFLHTSYEALDKFKPRPPPDVSYAELPRNRTKNRRGAPLPPGHSRVKLQLVLEEVGSDYINARWVSRRCLATYKPIKPQCHVTALWVYFCLHLLCGTSGQAWPTRCMSGHLSVWAP